jgi:predicted deacylase
MNDPIQLQSITIEGQKDGPNLLILGGIHGDEFESMWAIRRLKSALVPEALRGSVTLVPVVNEGAFMRGERTAEDELDLARTCPGRADGSITERVAHAVSALIREADYLIDLHSGGLIMQFYPTAGYTLHPDKHVLDVQRRMARAFNMPIIWGTTSRLDGRTLSVARDARIPAIYAEWMGGGACDPAGVEGYFEGCMNVIGELDMIERIQPVSRTEHVVEDDRDNAGVIQVNYPAPFSGYFEPNVKLMDPVKPGDLIGVVTDRLGDRREEIRSVQEGLVLCLRVYNRVLEEESLGAVLEI